jgi:predicted ATPase/class 3 adenylate cyclase/DNA-binding CsgD family transcriptional regulator
MPDLPTGTVTLLFTDIEGSTRLLQQLGERYADLLAECRQLLRSAFHQRNGHEVDTQGDAFFVAFARATDAVSAAVAAQRALFTHVWPEGVTVLVCMGLHTGEPVLSSEGYVGLDVHHAVRIMRAGHGGQVLLSQTTRDLVEHTLPEGVNLLDVGAHRLKDLQQPSHLFQLVIAGLTADFPPLKTLDAYPNNLPIQLTPLIGREQEVTSVAELLRRENVRLLTLVGPGGVGKTRLGLQIAADVRDDFTDGVWFISFVSISDPDLVVPTIAQALGLREAGERSVLERLQATLREKQMLLLLDNFEQVVTAAPLLIDFLERCPELKILVTSRAILHIQGEHEIPVPPLTVPDLKKLPAIEDLTQYTAVILFLQRARARIPNFLLTEVNAHAIVEICTRLDGLPLAIELAATRIKLFPPQALLARLGHRLQVLTGGARNLSVRQQTLRNTITWSYNLLDAEEKRLFRRLSVFSGGCTLEALEAICAELGDGDEHLLDRVSSLIDKSLLQQMAQVSEEPRLLMLETIKEYGLEELVTASEGAITHQVHAQYYLLLAEEAASQLASGAATYWLATLEAEHDNLRMVFNWSLTSDIATGNESQQRIEIGLRLGVALEQFWYMRGYWSEGRETLGKLLSQARAADLAGTSAYARVLGRAGELAWLHGEHNAARELAAEGIELARAAGDKAGLAFSLHVLGNAAWHQGDYEVAKTYEQESLALWRDVDDVPGIALALHRLGVLTYEQGEQDAGKTLLQESLTVCRRLGDKRMIAYCLLALGDQATIVGEYDAAKDFLEESLSLFQAIGDKRGIAIPLNNLGNIALSQEQYESARAYYQESLRISQDIGNKQHIAHTLSGLAGVVAVIRQEVVATPQPTLAVLPANFYERAAQLLGAIATLLQEIGGVLEPMERRLYDQTVTTARLALGEEAFTSAWKAGQAMMLEQAIALALVTAQVTPAPPYSRKEQLMSSPTPRAVSFTYPTGLTAREVEVLRLVAQGLTDAQVAEQLVISPRTVNSHLTSIYNKLGVDSRTAAARFAVDHRLV